MLIMNLQLLFVPLRMRAYDEKKETCGTICLKYLLFTFNFLFWVGLHLMYYPISLTITIHHSRTDWPFSESSGSLSV